jgi:hypothetical protein
MTASQSCKSDRLARCRSIGHDRVRSNIRPAMQIARQLAAFNAICSSFVSHIPIGQPAGSRSIQSHTASAAIKSP